MSCHRRRLKPAHSVLRRSEGSGWVPTRSGRVRPVLSKHKPRFALRLFENHEAIGELKLPNKNMAPENSQERRESLEDTHPPE